MLRERKLQALRVSLGRETSVKGDELTFFCSFHGANTNRTGGQLGVNVMTDVWHCWSCGRGGHDLLPLLKKGLNERAEYLAEIREKRGVKRQVKIDKKYEVPELPKEFKTLSQEWRTPDFRNAMEYLKQRGVGMREILRWKLGYCEDGLYARRIIFPSFDQFGVLNFFTGRSFVGKTPKYLSGNFDKDIIFNDYMIDWTMDITIVEGPFDMIKADHNVVPIQGSLLNEGSVLFDRIVTSGVDVFFALDPDASKHQIRYMTTLVSYGITCKSVRVDKKDVGEMTVEEFKEAKKHAFKISSDLDIMRLRVLS